MRLEMKIYLKFCIENVTQHLKWMDYIIRAYNPFQKRKLKILSFKVSIYTLIFTSFSI